MQEYLQKTQLSVLMDEIGAALALLAGTFTLYILLWGLRPMAIVAAAATFTLCMLLRARRSICCPESLVMAKATVSTPMPPSWMRIKMTICPKSVQCEAVSCTTRPVTQVADVEVKRQSKKSAQPSWWLAKGSHSRTAPVKITARNPADMVRKDAWLLKGMMYDLFYDVLL